MNAGLNVLGKPLSYIGEYEGLRLGGICKDATTPDGLRSAGLPSALWPLCEEVCTEVAKIQHSKKKIAQSKKAVL